MVGIKRESAFKALSPGPGTECICKRLAGIVKAVPGYLCYVPCAACQAPTAPDLTIHQTLYHIHEIKTISYKEDMTILSPPEEIPKAQRGAIICTSSHSQQGVKLGGAHSLGIRRGRE